MRNSKLRAWDKQDKRVITHEQEFVPLKVTNIGVFRQDCECVDRWELLPRERFILLFFSSVCDKHGSEIYEGDIITSHIEDIHGKMSVGIITVINGKVGISCLSDVSCPTYENATHSERMDFLTSSCTVLGNVFEDTELLPDYITETPIELLTRERSFGATVSGLNCCSSARLDSHSTTP